MLSFSLKDAKHVFRAIACCSRSRSRSRCEGDRLGTSRSHSRSKTQYRRFAFTQQSSRLTGSSPSSSTSHDGSTHPFENLLARFRGVCRVQVGDNGTSTKAIVGSKSFLSTYSSETRSVK